MDILDLKVGVAGIELDYEAAFCGHQVLRLDVSVGDATASVDRDPQADSYDLCLTQGVAHAGLHLWVKRDVLEAIYMAIRHELMWEEP